MDHSTKRYRSNIAGSYSSVAVSDSTTAKTSPCFVKLQLGDIPQSIMMTNANPANPLNKRREMRNNMRVQRVRCLRRMIILASCAEKQKPPSENQMPLLRRRLH